MKPTYNNMHVARGGPGRRERSPGTPGRSVVVGRKRPLLTVLTRERRRVRVDGWEGSVRLGYAGRLSGLLGLPQLGVDDVEPGDPERRIRQVALDDGAQILG